MKKTPPFNVTDCLQTDPFAGDFGNPSDKTLLDKITVARVGGECHDCGQHIKPREWIRRRTDVADGSIATYRWCSKCCSAMAKSWKDGGIAWERRIALKFNNG